MTLITHDMATLFFRNEGTAPNSFAWSPVTLFLLHVHVQVRYSPIWLSISFNPEILLTSSRLFEVYIHNIFTERPTPLQCHTNKRLNDVAYNYYIFH